MAKARKIEPRTKSFIAEYQRIKKAGKMPDYERLATILKVKSKSTISEILAQRQNIQPESWRRFKAHFGVEDGDDSEMSELTIEEAVRREREATDRERKALLEDKAFLQNLVNTNLSLVLATVRTISVRQQAVGTVLLDSVERMELEIKPKKKSAGALIALADKEIGQIEREAYAHDSVPTNM